MFLELIATFVIGVGAAGMVILINRLTGRRLPRWLMPVGAAVAMLCFTLWSEYSWFARTSASLPEDVVVAWTHEARIPYKPWTYLAPQVNRFTAVDTGSIQTNDALPDQRMVDIYFLGRWTPGVRVRSVMDCATHRRADLLEGVSMNADGAVEESAWIPLSTDDPVWAATCQREVT